MQSGKILYAEHQGAYVIKMIGDVRLTVCPALDDFLEKMFGHPKFNSVLIDLTEARGIDSTTLGVLAKLSIHAHQNYNMTPIIYSTNPDITRLLFSMGFEDVFEIREEVSDDVPCLGELPAKSQNEEEMRLQVIAAHRTLMGMNPNNQLKFYELVRNLEAGDCRH